MIPLAYVIRANEDVPAAAPPLQVGQPHSDAHGSIEGKLIARASHTHALFWDDNAAVYYALEEATHSTSYAASISPSRGPRMVVVHCWSSRINMLEMINGRQKFANKMTYCTHVCGKVNQTFHWRALLPNTIMHSYQCNSVLSTLHTSFQMSSPELGINWKESRVLIWVYKLQWQACGLTTAPME